MRKITLLAFLLLSAATTHLNAQTRPGAEDPNGTRRKGDKGDSPADGGRRGGSPEDMQARLMTSLRERFEVADDEEWKLISERLTKVTELRRNAAGAGAFAGFAGRGSGGAPGGDRGSGDRGKSSARGAGGTTEMTALSSAVRDKLPDAEIKSRLDRLREVRKNNEAKLSKAQEELRAVLSVRQEATAVVYGLLP